jgi:ElaB/YqjD/DUF883 family membrane-anchored ribosome-binding protein
MSSDPFTEQENAMSTQITQSGSEPSTGDQAKHAAGQAKEKAGSQLRSQVDQRSTDAGHKVGGFASDVRGVGEQLREHGKDQPARLAEQAADRAERLGSYLKESDADRILGDLEDFGRRRPWAMIGGGMALGLVASRLLKASSGDRYQQRTSGRLPERASYRPAETSALGTGPEKPAVPVTPVAFASR